MASLQQVDYKCRQKMMLKYLDSSGIFSLFII
jgi:hypothetical protein